MDDSAGFPKIEVVPKKGDEEFQNTGQAINAVLIDFWRWSASDLVSNATRGILAEYLVACAIGIADGARVEWDAYDLLIPKTDNRAEIRIEVKSSAYLQSWQQKKLSKIIFSIRPTYNLAAAIACFVFSTIKTNLQLIRSLCGSAQRFSVPH